jgi:hypothetical protein
MTTTRQNTAIATSAGAGALLVFLSFLKILFPGYGKTGQDLAVHEIKRAGGCVEVDENASGKPVVRVDFEGPGLGDDGLARMRPHLESLSRLRYLRITSMAMISDAGLHHLEGLTNLETMELYGNWLTGGRITESGVDRLRKKLPDVRITYFDSGPPRQLGTLPLAPLDRSRE